MDMMRRPCMPENVSVLCRRDSMLSPMIVMLLRLLTSAEIQRRTDFFSPFVLVRLAKHAASQHPQD